MLIVVLGSPNDANGNLLPFAVSRCQQTFLSYQAFSEQEQCFILCTGGFGEHFNCTETAHGEYLKRYLINLGIDENAFLPIVESRFTIEDATMAKASFNMFRDEKILVISSDFHMPRVKAIFTRVYPNHQLLFKTCKTNISQAEYLKLIAHEKLALQRDMNNLATIEQ